jgi:uncharacterized membrane protein YbhN (UPF0104 family)
VRAFYIGHLGKYVPGKAFVVIMRAGMVSEPGTKASVAAVCVFYETLSCIAAGGLLTALLGFLPTPEGDFLVVYYLLKTPLVNLLSEPTIRTFAGPVLALGMLLGLLPISPVVFNFLAERITRPFRKADGEPFPKLTPFALLLGLGTGGMSWVVNGLSLWAVIRSVSPVEFGLHELLLCVAVVACSMVAGFVLMVPAGFGVRDGLLALLLENTPYLGLDAFSAPLVAILFRLNWIVAELVASGLLVFLPVEPLSNGKASPATPER